MLSSIKKSRYTKTNFQSNYQRELFTFLLCFINFFEINTSFAASSRFFEYNHDMNPDKLQTILNEVKETYFSQELSGIKVRIAKMPRRDRKATFLQVKPKISHAIFKRPSKRTYLLQVNPLFYKNPPSESAIRAIFIHELTHVHDYVKMNFSKLTLFAFSYASNRNFRFKYERSTDKFALVRGGRDACVGLIEFRQWLYEQISPEDIEIKILMYLTPKEIQTHLISDDF